MTIAPAPLTKYESHYDPTKVLAHPHFRVLAPGDPAIKDKSTNLACAYNPAHEVHMIAKPTPTVGPGEAIVHVKATGICG
jgi:L-iditol 2-dehydrogenase